MPKIFPLSSKILIKKITSLGWKHIRTKGSHHFFQNQYGDTTVIPVHGNEDISVGLLKKILRDTKISGEQREEIMGY